MKFQDNILSSFGVMIGATYMAAALLAWTGINVDWCIFIGVVVATAGFFYNRKYL
jgi:hypothetical protein